jgi:DNA-binding NtrC family response regulator
MANRQKILVVDDLPDWRATLSGLLADEGYEVYVADSSDSALNLISAHHGFDLALIDMRLDESDEENTEGLDLAAKIKQRWPATKVLIITGYGTSEAIKRAMEPDSQGRRLVENFIPKTETENLVHLVQETLS